MIQALLALTLGSTIIIADNPVDSFPRVEQRLPFEDPGAFSPVTYYRLLADSNILRVVKSATGAVIVEHDFWGHTQYWSGCVDAGKQNQYSLWTNYQGKIPLSIWVDVVSGDLIPRVAIFEDDAASIFYSNVSCEGDCLFFGSYQCETDPATFVCLDELIAIPNCHSDHPECTIGPSAPVRRFVVGAEAGTSGCYDIVLKHRRFNFVFWLQEENVPSTF